MKNVRSKINTGIGRDASRKARAPEEEEEEPEDIQLPSIAAKPVKIMPKRG